MVLAYTRPGLPGIAAVRQLSTFQQTFGVDLN